MHVVFPHFGAINHAYHADRCPWHCCFAFVDSERADSACCSPLSMAARWRTSARGGTSASGGTRTHGSASACSGRRRGTERRRRRPCGHRWRHG